MAADAAYSTTTVITQTIDSVEWHFRIDESALTASLGGGGLQTTSSTDNYVGYRATKQRNELTGTMYIPTTFTVDGTAYTVNQIGNRAFYAYNALTAVVIPETITSVDSYGFHGSAAIKNFFIRGPETVSSGTQTYSDLSVNNNSCFTHAPCKLVLVGPNKKWTGTTAWFRFPAASGAVFLLPSRSDNTTWDNINTTSLEGTNPTIMRYGPGCDFDIAEGESNLTFTVNTEAAFTNAIAWAPTIKSAFGMDTTIAITNRIEISEDVEITESMLQNVTLTAPAWYLRFAVTTQAQLDNVLAAVATDVPIMLDVTGAKLAAEITVPEGREVAIYCPGGWTFGRKTKGLVISVH